jgi:hypothetical protein
MPRMWFENEGMRVYDYGNEGCRGIDLEMGNARTWLRKWGMPRSQFENEECAYIQLNEHGNEVCGGVNLAVLPLPPSWNELGKKRSRKPHWKFSLQNRKPEIPVLAVCSPTGLGGGREFDKTINGNRGEEELQETMKGESGTDFLREGEYVSRDRKSVL